MPLTEFEVVDRQEHVDDSVVIAAKGGSRRTSRAGLSSRRPS
jgi:hypothetical protein